MTASVHCCLALCFPDVSAIVDNIKEVPSALRNLTIEVHKINDHVPMLKSANKIPSSRSHACSLAEIGWALVGALCLIALLLIALLCTICWK